MVVYYAYSKMRQNDLTNYISRCFKPVKIVLLYQLRQIGFLREIKMGYEAAISKAWTELGNVAENKDKSVRFLADEYSIDLENKKVFSLSCNVPAKSYVSILVLHYLKQKLAGLPYVKGEWISFKQLDGGQGYYPTFKKRVIEPITRKYQANPDVLFSLTERFKAKRAQLADVSVVVDAFDNVPILIEIWKPDEEFGPEVNILFDKSIIEIFCTEDIVILAEFLAHNI